MKGCILLRLAGVCDKYTCPWGEVVRAFIDFTTDMISNVRFYFFEISR